MRLLLQATISAAAAADCKARRIKRDAHEMISHPKMQPETMQINNNNNDHYYHRYCCCFWGLQIAICNDPELLKTSFWFAMPLICIAWLAARAHLFAASNQQPWWAHAEVKLVLRRWRQPFKPKSYQGLSSEESRNQTWVHWQLQPQSIGLLAWSCNNLLTRCKLRFQVYDKDMRTLSKIQVCVVSNQDDHDDEFIISFVYWPSKQQS